MLQPSEVIIWTCLCITCSHACILHALWNVFCVACSSFFTACLSQGIIPVYEAIKNLCSFFTVNISHLTFYLLTCAELFIGNWKMYIQFISFLHTDMAQVVGNLLLCKTRNYLFYTVNIMSADVLMTQGARASTPMIFTMLNRINSVHAC